MRKLAIARGRYLLSGAFGLVLRNSAWTGGASLVTALALFGETIILARYLGSATFGVYVLVTAYPDLIQQVLYFRVGDALSRYLPAFFEEKRVFEAVAMFKLLWILDAAVAGLTFPIVLLTAGVATRIFIHNEADSQLMVIYAISIVVGTFASSWGALLRSLGKFPMAFVSDASAVVFRFGLLFAVVLSAGTLNQLMWARVAASALAMLLGAGLALPAFARVAWHARRASISALREQSREIRGFLVSTNLFGIVRLVSAKLDVLLVGALAGASAASLYRVALQFALVPMLVGDALSASVFPTFSRAVVRGRWDEIREVTLRSSALMAVLVVPPSIVVALFGGDLIGLLAGDQYAAAGTPLAICLIGIIPFLVTFWLGVLLLSTGHAAAVLKTAAVAGAAQLAVIFLLASRFGASGGAVAVAVLFLVTMVLQLRLVSRYGLLSRDRVEDSSAVVSPADIVS